MPVCMCDFLKKVINLYWYLC